MGRVHRRNFLDSAMKLNRWQVDRLYDLVTADLRRVSDKRRELIKCDDDAANSAPLRREIQRLMLLRIKLDRLRKGHDMKGKK